MDEKLMNKQTVALIALFAGWIPAASVANATTYEDIAGQWCGDVTDYVFTPDTLTVKFHDARPANVFKITKYTYTASAATKHHRVTHVHPAIYDTARSDDVPTLDVNPVCHAELRCRVS